MLVYLYNERNLGDESWSKKRRFVCGLPFSRKEVPLFSLWNARVMSEGMQVLTPSEDNRVSVLAVLPESLFSPSEL